jgi:RNA polymerase sigma-70 factor (ECF subfamily)
MTEQHTRDDSAIARQRDRRLVRRLLAGERGACEEFVSTYFARLYRFALYRLGSPQAVDEVVQAVLEVAARRLETWRGEATLYTWLVRICQHEIAHFRQRMLRDRALMTPFLNDEVMRRAVENVEALAAEGPEAEAERSELRLQIGRALDQLPEQQARALEMKYLDGESSQQIAARLGIGDVAVQSLLARARRGFREVFGAAAQRQDARGAPTTSTTLQGRDDIDE